MNERGELAHSAMDEPETIFHGKSATQNDKGLHAPSVQLEKWHILRSSAP
eukprot:CAMPEP_0170569376 /NCGR_PEP_ID=MMETSP0224-20130122/508_1 /TAXON_ID=285029 /ORGANISM="Togula jolla, Strain CCCM 725" /LENGTH=49 /DNA_ID=CAMNT_0010891511 /DNA_START=65 /DNA_END=214 /DNA_ORIENTATION=-